MKAVIIDDEPRAIDLLSSYLEKYPEFVLSGSFRNPIKGLSFLNEEEVDVVFLDINMPRLNGLQLSRIIQEHSIKIIFTTAYSEYAVESYDVNAFDYLLKPISRERFHKCITKLLDSYIQSENIKIKSGSEVYRIKMDEILYLKKDGNYIYYVLAGRKIMARQTVSEALDHLSERFVRVHKSFIVNMDKIDKYNAQTIHIEDHTVSLGPAYQSSFKNKID